MVDDTQVAVRIGAGRLLDLISRWARTSVTVDVPFNFDETGPGVCPWSASTRVDGLADEDSDDPAARLVHLDAGPQGDSLWVFRANGFVLDLDRLSSTWFEILDEVSADE